MRDVGGFRDRIPHCEKTMIEEATASFIKEVGVPVVAFILMYALYLKSQQWHREQQLRCEERYERMEKRFLALKKISEEHDAALRKITDELGAIRDEVKKKIMLELERQKQELEKR